MTDVTTTIAELEKLSWEFRTVVSRTRRSSVHDARSNLMRLLGFVRDHPLFAEQVREAPVPDESPLVALERVRSRHARLDLPISPAEEVGYLHKLLSELAESEKDFVQIAYGYGGKTTFSEAVRELLDGTVTPYCERLIEPVAKLLIDHKAAMAGRPNENMVIHVTGGTSQINVAREQGRIVAQQQVGTAAVDVFRLAQALLAEVERHRGGDIAAEALNELQDIGEGIAEQAQLPEPKKGILKSLRAGLGNLTGVVQGAASLAEAAGGLHQGLEPLIDAVTR